MSYWVEIVCDTCAYTERGMGVQPGQAFARRLEAESRFKRTVAADGYVYHICPACARNTPKLEAPQSALLSRLSGEEASNG